MIQSKDQMGNIIKLASPARRIVSLVPSQTELLSDLNLKNEVVGITKFCIHPKEWKSEKMIIGGTKDISISTIEELQPDLIIANKEENKEADVLVLQKKSKVWLSDVATLEDAYQMIASIGELTNRSADASAIIREIQDSFKLLPAFKSKRTLYLIWRKPWMTVGSDTFIHEMMKTAGFKNVISDDRYPTLSEDDIRTLDPEVVLLSSEPFPFKLQHVEEIIGMLPTADVRLVDGEMFSWYGSRLRMAAGYFDKIRKD